MSHEKISTLTMRIERARTKMILAALIGVALSLCVQASFQDYENYGLTFRIEFALPLFAFFLLLTLLLVLIGAVNEDIEC
jgi:succinate dehydrogenase hydrophobic anchor subunit